MSMMNHQPDDKPDRNKVIALTLLIDRVLDDCPDLTPCEALSALMNAIGNSLMAIGCPACREVGAQFVGDHMPLIISTALADAAVLRDGKLPTGKHLH